MSCIIQFLVFSSMAGFLSIQEFLHGANSIALQISIVMLIFLLFSNQILAEQPT